ncbi:MAG: CaiB/BaiF CoA transferase family protein [Vicinamibacterales bacterium]
MPLPLEGLLVVSVEQAVAAPFATRQLADLGARVIKIERPAGGDFARGYDTTVRGLSSYFVWLNRSKESITLDIKRPEAERVLRALVARADVVVQNLGPGAAERAGLLPETLRAAQPRLIVCNVTGYGSSGPYRNKKAYDLLVQSETGLVTITGGATEPAKVPISVADIAAGMYALTGVLTALVQRSRTGEGTIVEVSLFDALAEWMSQPAYFTAYGGRAPARTGARHASIAPYGPIETADGAPVYLGIQNEREWERFCRLVLGRPELFADPRFASNPDRVRHRDELERLINETLGAHSSARIIGLLEEAGIACARMNTVEEFLAHAQLAERERWRTVGSPVGDLQTLLPPVTLDGLEPRMDAVPALGEHTDSILAELGIDRDTIAGWRTRGIV